MGTAILTVFALFGPSRGIFPEATTGPPFSSLIRSRRDGLEPDPVLRTRTAASVASPATTSAGLRSTLLRATRFALGPSADAEVVMQEKAVSRVARTNPIQIDRPWPRRIISLCIRVKFCSHPKSSK